MKWIPFWVQSVIASLTGAFLMVSILGTMNFRIDAFEFSVGIQIFDRGQTEITIPPVGTISAKTHISPLKLDVTLKNIDMDLLRRMLEKESIRQQEIVEKVQNEAKRVLRIFILRLLFLAALGGALGVALLRPVRAIHCARGGLIGMSIMGLLLVGTFASYKTDGFINPKYEGILKAAPWMVGLFQTGLAKVNELGQQMQVMSSNLYLLFERIDNLQPLGLEGAIKVLHVSDIHNNPAAYDFISEIAANFGVDIVIDTGDISDYGSPLEALLVKQLSDLPVPYVFTPGNHDSPEIIAAMGKLPNVTVLDQQVINLKGLNIAGIADPASATSNIKPPSQQDVWAAVGSMERVLAEQEGAPDILTTHELGVARYFIGRVPVILHGHDHRFSIAVKDATVVVDAGTSGAAGIRGFQTGDESPYTVVLLHFSPENGRMTLLAADVISVNNLRSGFTVERRVFPKKLPQEEVPEPEPASPFDNQEDLGG
ncbi:MAG: metallophosphoesterase family protein [Bacillota bacterium]